MSSYVRDSFNRVNQGSVQSFHKKIGVFPGKMIITREFGLFRINILGREIYGNTTLKYFKLLQLIKLRNSRFRILLLNCSKYRRK